jgi:hypothetical protein
MADGGESGGGGHGENEKDDGRGARNEFWEMKFGENQGGELPQHISYHDII